MKPKSCVVFSGIISLLTVTLLCGGCASFFGRKAEVYPMSYDRAYLTALSAIDDMESWSLTETDELRGHIRVENRGYLKPTQSVTLAVKRLGPFSTKVEIEDQHRTHFRQAFFEAIDKRMARDSLSYPS